MNTYRQIILIGLLLTGTSALATEFNQLQANQSSMSFGYRQMGVPMEGKFAKFNAQLTFDPDKLAHAQAKIDVYLASIDTGSSDANEEVSGKLWFNSKSYPLASFVSSSVKAMGGNQYQAMGKLTIKGRTLEVIAPFTFNPSGNQARFDGTFSINRLPYGIGEGEWTDLATVANEVAIKFHLTVSASPVSPPATQPSRKKP